MLRFTASQLPQISRRRQPSHLNEVSVVGLVAQKRLVRGRVAEAGTGQGLDRPSCLHVLLQQSANPIQAIPIRLYGNFAAKYAKSIRVGSPIQVRCGALSVDSDAEVSLQDDFGPARPSLYVNVSALYTVTRDDIEEIPDWAAQMGDRRTSSRPNPDEPFDALTTGERPKHATESSITQHKQR